jgi:hypothetical protein
LFTDTEHIAIPLRTDGLVPMIEAVSGRKGTDCLNKIAIN